MHHWSIVGVGLVTIGTLAGGALAVGPSKADMDFCNQKAAQVAAPSPVQPTRSPAALHVARIYGRNARSDGCSWPRSRIRDPLRLTRRLLRRRLLTVVDPPSYTRTSP